MPPPERWIDYNAVGEVVPGTNLIAFKVPLKENLQKLLPDDEKFFPNTLIDIIRSKGRELGLVIDLTFTEKYYRKDDFIQAGVEYEKIFTAGQEIPDQYTYQCFVDAIKNYAGNGLIGVHCTHGVNRTGYMICRYLIEERCIPPDDAIKMFNSARGHDLERLTYLMDLRERIPGKIFPRVQKPLENLKEKEQKELGKFKKKKAPFQGKRNPRGQGKGRRMAPYGNQFGRRQMSGPGFGLMNQGMNQGMPSLNQFMPQNRQNNFGPGMMQSMNCDWQHPNLYFQTAETQEIPGNNFGNNINGQQFNYCQGNSANVFDGTAQFGQVDMFSNDMANEVCAENYQEQFNHQPHSGRNQYVGNLIPLNNDFTECASGFNHSNNFAEAVDNYGNNYTDQNTNYFQDGANEFEGNYASEQEVEYSYYTEDYQNEVQY